MSLRAVKDYIIVQIEYSEKSKGGIVIPDKAKQYSGSFVGKIISIGPECSYKDELKIGDFVAYRRHEGFLVRYKGENLWSLKSNWVVAKIEKDEN